MSSLLSEGRGREGRASCRCPVRVWGPWPWSQDEGPADVWLSSVRVSVRTCISGYVKGSHMAGFTEVLEGRLSGSKGRVANLMAKSPEEGLQPLGSLTAAIWRSPSCSICHFSCIWTDGWSCLAWLVWLVHSLQNWVCAGGCILLASACRDCRLCSWWLVVGGFGLLGFSKCVTCVVTKLCLSICRRAVWTATYR